ncbi:MAG: hypothetical protein DRI95_01100 [Bacteroidetes bacterium]|nr:MAG: hypothetical protein DRI95_01100 [Bacteroidota bacterium]
MGFIPISIDKYVKKHLKNNPSENEKDLRSRLDYALKSYENGERCSCGNDIWVVGSAAVGNSCFTCITGESHPTDDYEIESAVKKRESTKGRRYIDEIDKTKIHGFFDDDGYEINTDLIKKPPLCVTCIKDDDPNEELLCNMTRYDQKDELEFKCFAYKKR